jgi:TPR repeat protein
MQKSARQGAAKSQNSLAMMYFKGIGVKANYQSAYFWAASSAKQGNVLSLICFKKDSADA